MQLRTDLTRFIRTHIHTAGFFCENMLSAAIVGTLVCSVLVVYIVQTTRIHDAQENSMWVTRGASDVLISREPRDVVLSHIGFWPRGIGSNRTYAGWDVRQHIALPDNYKSVSEERVVMPGQHQCWGAPADYKTWGTNPFVFTVHSVKRFLHKPVLFYDNGTMALGVGYLLCPQVTGDDDSVPFWDAGLGDFMFCGRRENAQDPFVGVYCKLSSGELASVCPSVSALSSTACAYLPVPA